MGSLGLGRRLAHILEIADEATRHAERMGADFAIVAVDRGGRDVLVYRSDLCSYNALEPARKKAITSAAMGMPTSVVTGFTMGDPVGQRAMAASPDMLAVPGGFPIMLDNVVVGGIGLSGGHYNEDHLILAKAIVKDGPLPPAMVGPPQGGPPPGMMPQGGPPNGMPPQGPGGPQTGGGQ
jgi:glc operon protein GlcG